MTQNIFIARQPIFDREYKLASYELLFRNHKQRQTDEHMTAQVMTTALLDIGLDKLSGGYKVNINAPASFLLGKLEMLHTLPPNQVGIEILETVPVTEAIIAACKTLKHQGFTILLDDVVYAPHLKPLVELADIIKVDLPRIRNLEEEVRILRQYPARILAEKVETYQQFEQVKALNFDYVQGYFFSKPEVIQGKKIADAKLSILRALQQVMKAQAISDIHDVIKSDVSLSYRLMKYINSASLGVKKTIESIEQALALLGLNHVRRWLSLLALATLGQNKTSELLKTALIRAYTLENIARQCREKEVGDDFLLGMFSILDALLDVSMQDAIQDLYLPHGVREGLLDASSMMGQKLSMCKSLEQGDWHAVETWALKGKRIEITHIMRIYTDALAWSDTQVAQIIG